MKETSIIYQTFGGYLQSQVRCHRCKFESNTFEPFLHLSLEIKHCDTLAKAFRHFTTPEVLERDNQYNCTRCRTAVDASKQFTIYSAPLILTVQLKRFDFTRSHQGKIGRFVEFPEVLSLDDFMTHGRVGFIVHTQRSLHLTRCNLAFDQRAISTLCCAGALWSNLQLWSLLLLRAKLIQYVVHDER